MHKITCIQKWNLRKTIEREHEKYYYIEKRWKCGGNSFHTEYSLQEIHLASNYQIYGMLFCVLNVSFIFFVILLLLLLFGRFSFGCSVQKKGQTYSYQCSGRAKQNKAEKRVIQRKWQLWRQLDRHDWLKVSYPLCLFCIFVYFFFSYFFFVAHLFSPVSVSF